LFGTRQISSTSAPEELPELCKDDLQIELSSCDGEAPPKGALVAAALHWQPLA